MAALLLFAGLWMLFHANAKGPASVTWVTLNLSLLLPILLFAVFFHEPLYHLDLLSLGLFVSNAAPLFARVCPIPANSTPNTNGCTYSR